MPQKLLPFLRHLLSLLPKRLNNSFFDTHSGDEDSVNLIAVDIERSHQEVFDIHSPRIRRTIKFAIIIICGIFMAILYVNTQLSKKIDVLHKSIDIAYARLSQAEGSGALEEASNIKLKLFKYSSMKPTAVALYPRFSKWFYYVRDSRAITMSDYILKGKEMTTSLQAVRAGDIATFLVGSFAKADVASVSITSASYSPIKNLYTVGFKVTFK